MQENANTNIMIMKQECITYIFIKSCAYQISCNTIQMSLFETVVFKEDGLICYDLSNPWLSWEYYLIFKVFACFYVQLPHHIGS
jgi:hypothetical protein